MKGREGERERDPHGRLEGLVDPGFRVVTGPIRLQNPSSQSFLCKLPFHEGLVWYRRRADALEDLGEGYCWQLFSLVVDHVPRVELAASTGGEFRFRIQCSVFRVWGSGLGCRVWGSG